MIAATAGTTNAGAIDPLKDCRSVADPHGMHFHVDAAWAGALILDPSRRDLLAGIEAPDSVTIDAHKWLSVPMGAGMVFVRDRGAVARAFAVQTGHMPHGDGHDAYITTSQWSRRFIGLHLWMMLRSTGMRGYSALFDQHFKLAQQLEALLGERGWRIRNTGPLPVVLFDDGLSACPSRVLADTLESDARVWLGCVRFEGRELLRACITSFLTTESDLELLLDRLDWARERVAGEGELG